VFGDFRIEELAPQSSEVFEGASLIGADQPRIARHIGCENGSEAAGLAQFVSPTARRKPDR
jgi:hypothetical protein